MPTHVVECDSSDWTLALADVSSAGPAAAAYGGGLGYYGL